MRTDRQLLQDAMTNLLAHSADWRHHTPPALLKEIRAALEPGFATIPHIVVKSEPPLCGDQGCDHAGTAHVCRDTSQDTELLDMIWGEGLDVRAVDLKESTGRGWSVTQGEVHAWQNTDDLRAVLRTMAQAIAYPLKKTDPAMTRGTFEQAWANFEKAGFRYGKAQQESVKFGWKIAHGYTPEQARGGK